MWNGLAPAYEDRWEGENKVIFRGDSLVYTVHADDPMGILADGEDWFDRALLQTRVWDHNLQKLYKEGIPLTMENYRTDAMLYLLDDERIPGHILSPSLISEEFQEVEPLTSRTTMEELDRDERREVEWMQEQLGYLVEEGEIAVQESENTRTDFHGPGCLRQFGIDGENVYLLEFGEYQHRLDGPYFGEEFLESHGIERPETNVVQPIQLR